MNTAYDDHDACRKEIQYWRHKCEEPTVIQQVVRIDASEKGHEVLIIVRVDAFPDGLRVVVR